MPKQVAIVDDEPDIVELISLHLRRSGFQPAGFSNAADFFQSLSRRRFCLIILDLMLPDIDGIEVCKRLKSETATKNIPIIMLTARAEESDKILGLELGADDYVTKPFSPKELVARIKAVLRRKLETTGISPEVIEIGGMLVIDASRYQVEVKGKKIGLTTTEFRILKILSEKKGRVISRDQMLDYLWGAEKAILDRTIDVHIKNIREKLGPAKKFIKNIRGIGYKIEE